jgi:hypothetical protein
MVEDDATAPSDSELSDFDEPGDTGIATQLALIIERLTFLESKY